MPITHIIKGVFSYRTCLNQIWGFGASGYVSTTVRSYDTHGEDAFSGSIRPDIELDVSIT